MTTVSDISNRLSADAQHVKGEMKSVVYDNGAGIVGALKDWGYQPGENVKVECEVDLGAAEVYTEGQALPSATESTYVIGSQAFKHFRCVIRESGHERRARGSADQGTRIQDPERKLKRAIFAIRQLLGTTFDDTSSYGLQGLCSATTNWLDQARGTYTKLKSYELDASSAAISTALLNRFAYLSQEDPYQCQFDVVVMSPTQASKLAELMSGKLALPDAVGGSGSLVPTDMSVGAAPVMVLPQLTNSVVLGLSGFRSGEHWGIVHGEESPGRFHILDLGAANADNPMNLQISTSCAIVCTAPHQQAKLHTLSTG